MNSVMEIRRGVVVAAEREKMWRVITQPEHFSKWFGGKIAFERNSKSWGIQMDNIADYLQRVEDVF